MSKRREISKTISSLAELPGLITWVREMVRKGLASGPVMVVLTRERRTKDQNNKLWPMLTDISRQCQMVIGTEWQWASEEDWKDLFTAALTGEQRVAQGINGGVVFLGRSTSKMKKREFSDLIELIYAYGAEHGVVWSEQTKKRMGEAA